MKHLRSLKQRLVALLVLAAFAVAMFSPTQTAEAALVGINLNTNNAGNNVVTLRVSWNSGPQ